MDSTGGSSPRSYPAYYVQQSSPPPPQQQQQLSQSTMRQSGPTSQAQQPQQMPPAMPMQYQPQQSMVSTSQQQALQQPQQHQPQQQYLPANMLMETKMHNLQPLPIGTVSGGQIASSDVRALMENNSLQGFRLGGSGGQAMNTKDFVSVVASDIQDFREIRDQDERYAAVQKDYQELSRMTLLDDENQISWMYIRELALLQSKAYFVAYVANNYLEKYNKLLTKYPSVYPWMLFCVSALVYHGESFLKSLSASNSFAAPTVNRSHLFTSFSRKRRAGDSSSKSAQPPAKRTANPSQTHKFYQSDLYKDYKSVFSVGQMLIYMIPSDFAAVNMTASPADCVRYLKSAEHGQSRFAGVVAKFSRPLVVNVAAYSRANNDFLTGDYMDHPCSLVANMMNKKINEFGFSIGVKKDNKYEAIPPDPMQMNLKSLLAREPTDVSVALLHNFTTVATVAGVCDSRGYSPTIYTIRNSTPSAENIQNIMKSFENEIVKRAEELDYDPSVLFNDGVAGDDEADVDDLDETQF